ncbi:DUF1499 domain-containing protein [Gymnodinialimonas sp. 2305UL16-5]|uniref:DUF1499 domain-containing protein n=1 Tax=Gymnodinialimonas mytili TaxID=3126503 RepID=UPI00309DD8FD
MRFLLYAVVALALVFLAFAVYVRFAPIDAEGQHVDPAEVVPPGTPNFARMAGPNGSQVSAQPDVVGERIAALAEAEGAEILAGSIADRHITYVVRTPVMRYPDIVTLRWVAEAPGTRVDIYSRSIYGMNDLGANTVRVQQWLTALHGDES